MQSLSTLDKIPFALGRYGNVSEVVRAALRLLEDYEKERETKLSDLKVALEEGIQGPFTPFDINQAEQKRSVRKQTRGKHVSKA